MLRTRLPLLFAVATAAATAACGSGSSAPGVTASRPTVSTAASATAASGSDSGPTPSQQAGASTAAPDGHTGSAPTGAGASSRPGEGSGAAEDSSSGTGAGSAATGDTGSAFTPAGRYTYRLSGQSSSPLGKKSIDGTSSVVVDKPDGHRQHSTDNSDQGSGEQTVLAKPDGLYLVDISMDQDGFHVEFRDDAGVLVLPSKPVVGQHWQWTLRSTDGKYTLHTSIKVAAVDGTAQTPRGREPTVSLTSVIVLTGDSINVTMHRTDVATRDGLIVRQRAVSDGTAYGAHFSSDVTRRLEVG